MDLGDKLKVLAGAARYDASCASSGSRRGPAPGRMGTSVPSGVCHSFTEDGRCISLLKVLFTNHCIYDCSYCVNRSSNDIPRAAFQVSELVDLTVSFYRRNYIEGLFLSSGIVKSPDDTMERLIRVARTLRVSHGFNGYIHLKCIPGAGSRLVREAGLYADRLSVNIELPSEHSLIRLASDKSYSAILDPMQRIRDSIVENRDERKAIRSAPVFAPAGQSTQLIVGASPERDYEILRLARGLYRLHDLRRVYYSAYVPVNADDSRLPEMIEPPPAARESALSVGLADSALWIRTGGDPVSGGARPGSQHRPQASLCIASPGDLSRGPEPRRLRTDPEGAWNRAAVGPAHRGPPSGALHPV